MKTNDIPITHDDKYTDELDVIQEFIKVHTRAKHKDNLSSDIILAKLPEHDEQYIVDMNDLAFSMYVLAEKLDKNCAKRIFDRMTYKTQLLAIVNRNKDGNYLISTLSNNIQQKTIEQEDDSMGKKFMSILAKKDTLPKED